MTLITKGVTIPNNGGVIIANNVNLTKVIAVHGGTSTTVWEKISQLQLINGSSVSNGGSFSYYAVNGGYLKSQNAHYMTTSGNKILVHSYQNAPCTEDGDDNQVMNRITWNSIEVSSFSKIKMTFSVFADTSIDGYSKARVYIVVGNKTSNIIEGTGYHPWHEDEEVKEENDNPFEYSGSIELDISSLTGAQTIQVNLFHETQDYYNDGGYTSSVYLYISKLELT